MAISAKELLMQRIEGNNENIRFKIERRDERLATANEIDQEINALHEEQAELAKAVRVLSRMEEGEQLLNEEKISNA